MTCQGGLLAKAWNWGIPAVGCSKQCPHQTLAGGLPLGQVQYNKAACNTQSTKADVTHAPPMLHAERERESDD
jgi:hypothetical protein